VAGPAAAAPPASDQELFELARRCVLRLVVEREPDQGAPAGWTPTAFGSAVVLEAEPPDAPRTLTLATAYHVLVGARRFRVYAPSGQGLVATSKSDTECFVDRSRELAFVRIELDPGRGGGLGAIDPEKSAQVPQQDGPPGTNPTGMAFGYSRELSLPLDSKRVDFLGAVLAQDLGLVRRIGFRPGRGERSPGQMPFQLLGDQATLEGMSGGLAINRAGEFAGLIYGRRTDQFNLIIPAQQVLVAWRRALQQRKGGDSWKHPDQGPFLEPSLFHGGADETDAAVEDRLDWGSLEGLTVLLGDDPLHAIDRFQEIVVTPPRRGERPPNLEIFVSRQVTLPNRDHALEIWVNGEKKEIDPVTQTVSLPLADLPGETMVTVIKQGGQVNDFELGKLLIPSTVDLAFQYEGEEPFRRVVRSLPVIVQSYPLFITIVNDPRVQPRSAATQPPANARLALRLDYAQAVLNQAPFNLEVGNRVDLNAPDRAQAAAKKPGEQDTVYEGWFRLDEKAAWRLQRVSAQRLGLTLDGHVVFKSQVLRYRDITLEPRPGPDKVWPPRFTLSGRFQFPYQMPGRDPKGNTLGLALSARATGANGTGSLRVDLREGLQLDVAGILRQLFTDYVNIRLIANAQPHRIDDEKIAPFLERLGFSAPGGWVPEIRRAAFVHDPATQKEWLILTFRLDPKGQGPGGAPPADSDLLAPPKGAPGRVIDVEAWGVPGSLAVHFPGLETTNPVVAAALGAARADHLTLTLDLDADPSRWFRGLERTEELFFFRDNARSVGRRIQQAIEHSVKNAEAIELRAVADPGFVREVLKAALRRPDMKLVVGPGKASLRVVARQGRVANHVSLLMQGGPLELTSPGDAEIDLGGGTFVRGARLKISQLDVRGTFDAAEVKGGAGAELSVAQLKTGGLTFNDLAGRVTFALDSAPGRRELGVAIVEGVKFALKEVMIGNHPVTVRIEGKISVPIDRDLNFLVDPNALPGQSPR
jgi:hypothetical protein